MRQIDPLVELASGIYDVDKMQMRNMGYPHRLTIPVIEKRLGLRPRQLVNYRANYLSHRPNRNHER